MKYRMLWMIFIFFVTLISSITSIAKPPLYTKDLNDALAISESTNADVLLVFGADWCNYCNMLKKDIANNESIVEDYIVCYINIDEQKDLAKEYKVKTIPDYMILKNKEEVKRKKGYDGIRKFNRWLER